MNILVVGVTGFVGGALATRLCARGDNVIGVSRNRPLGNPPLRHVFLDMAEASNADAWLPLLSGVDAVVNCAGILQDAPGDSLNSVHRVAPDALFRACEKAGVRRVVHLSAVGVDRTARSDFSRTKLAGDESLMERDLDWVILRPSVVVGRGAYGGSALLRGLAALPVLPLPSEAGALQIVQLEDLLDTILFFLDAKAPGKRVLEIVGPRVWPLGELIALFRRWLGWPRALEMVLPKQLQTLAFRLGDAAGYFGWRSAIRSTAGLELLRGATGDPATWTKVTGIVPRDIEQGLLCDAAPVQERWFAKLYLLRPWLFGIVALFWVSTGLIALGPGWQYGVDLMNEGGVFGWASSAVIVAGALCDIAVGLAIAWRRTTRWGVIAGIVVTVIYALIGTALVPRLWVDPLGPMLKVLPILALHLAALGIVEER